MKKPAVVLLAICLALSLASAQEREFNNRSFARLSYLTGKTFIQKASDLAYVEGEVNMPIIEGDRIGTTDGRAEIYLGAGAYLRMDLETKLDVLNLPEHGDDLTQLKAWSGSVYLSLNRLDREKSIEVHTSDVSVYLLDLGLYRFDVRENGGTEIFVFYGVAEAAGETGSVLIKEAQRLEAISGRFTSQTTSFRASAEDSFDRWNEYRDAQLNTRTADSYLPEELEDFEGELNEYGEWAYEPAYGHVWVPGGMEPGWRPYWHGRWSWYANCGWTWIPYEPWGWATTHFGRWHWNTAFGWYWIPTRTWGSAWVGWYAWGDYWGWAPLSYYGYPGVIINDVYHPRYSGSYHPYDSRTVTVIHKRQLDSRNVSKVALNRSRVNTLGKLGQTRGAPMGRPESSRVSVQPLGDRKVFLHQSDKRAPYPRPGTTPAAKLKKNEGTGAVPSTRPGSARINRNPTRQGESERRIGYPPSTKITGASKSGRNILDRSRRSPASRFYDSIKERDSRITRRRIAPSGGGTTTSQSGRVSKPPAMRTPARSTRRSGTATKQRTPPSRSRATTTRSRKSGSSKTKKKK